MRYFIFLLLLSAFLQTAFIPLNLCLLLMICRSYAIEERENYYLGFASGIFLSILTATNLGFWTFIFVLYVKIIHAIRRLPVTARGVTIIPVSFLLFSFSAFLEYLIMGVSFSFFSVLISSLLSLPIYLVIKIWEDRFIAKPEIKLKV